MQAGKSTRCKPRLGPEPAQARMGCPCRCGTNIESWEAQQQLQQNRSCAGGRSRDLNSFIHTWLLKGGRQWKPNYLTHTHCVHMLQTKNRNTQAVTRRKVWDSISAKEPPNNFSHLYIKNPPATGDRKDTVSTLAGQRLTRSAAAPTRFNWSFKFWNLTCKKRYSASVWRPLGCVFSMKLSFQLSDYVSGLLCSSDLQVKINPDITFTMCNF